MANEQNLLRGNPSTQFKSGENAVENGRKGGIASGKAKREKKSLEQLASAFLKRDIDIKDLPEDLLDLTKMVGEDKTGASYMIVGQAKSAMMGSEKSARLLMELSEKAEKAEEKENKWTVPITDITKDFVDVYRAIHDAFDGTEDIHEIIIKGGRGSIKSNAISDFAYECILQDKQAHVVYTRRYKVDLRGSVFNQFQKTVIRYNDLDNWEFKQSPLCAVYKPTGQMVMFVGADKPISLKSFNVPFGYVKMLIHEECDEMAGIEQMDNIEDTFLRSDTPALDIKIFNPPKSKNNFMNEYTEQAKNKPQTRVFHSYYFNVPIKWLGKRFFERAEWFKIHKPLYYKNNYLGEVTGTGGSIFENVEVRPITDVEIDNFGYINNGLDFGFEHPQTFERSYYDDETDTLYCFEEVFMKHCKNSTFARKIKQYMTAEIICDSARPDAISELQDWGFNAIGAKKRWSANKGRDYCWEWLQQTTKIVVDAERCPHLAHELTTLEHEQLADGSFSDAYPRLDEDCTMALIYGLNRVIMESRRNNGLYDDFSEEDSDYEDEE